ncbi:MAG: ABC transporter substrate-binding protein [Actinomycetota bacterium]
MLKRFMVIALALAMTAAACGDDAGDSTGDAGTTTSAPDETTTTTDAPEDGDSTTTTDAPVELAASWKGVTADTINIAVSILDFSDLIELGLQDFGWGDQRLMWEFYVDEINANGGVAGRQLEMYIDFYNPGVAIDAEASCLRMTEDRDVFVVVGAFVGPAQTATPCLTRQEDLVIIGGIMTIDLLEGSDAVWVNAGTADRRRIPTFFDLLGTEGYLDGRRVAIVSGNEDLASTEDVIIPLLDERGVEVVLTAVNTVPTEDVVAEDDFWRRTAERIKTEDVDVIIVNGDTTGAVRGIRPNGLEQEVWAIRVDQLTNIGGTADRTDADGWLGVSLATPAEQWNEPNMQACVQRFVDAHPDIVVDGPETVGELDEKWYIELQVICRRLAVLEMVFNAAGPELTPQTVQAAYESLGEVELPGYFFSSWGPGKPDANDGFRLAQFDSTEGEGGAMVPITDILDTTP